MFLFILCHNAYIENKIIRYYFINKILIEKNIFVFCIFKK